MPWEGRAFCRSVGSVSICCYRPQITHFFSGQRLPVRTVPTVSSQHAGRDEESPLPLYANAFPCIIPGIASTVLSGASESPGGLAGPHLRLSDSAAGRGLGLSICISHKFPGHVDVAGPGENIVLR